MDKETIKITGNKPICIIFNHVINTSTVNILNAAFSDAMTKGHDDIHFLFSTPGGDVASGISAYNFIRALPILITVYNIGTIDSIGNVIFMGGKTRISLPISRFMFHGVGFDIGQARFELKDLRERIGNVENDQSMIADILAKETNLTTDEVQNLFLEAAFLRADEALEKGIVNSVMQIALPIDIPMMPLVIQG